MFTYHDKCRLVQISTLYLFFLVLPLFTLRTQAGDPSSKSVFENLINIEYLPEVRKRIQFRTDQLFNNYSSRSVDGTIQFLDEGASSCNGSSNSKVVLPVAQIRTQKMSTKLDGDKYLHVFKAYYIGCRESVVSIEENWSIITARKDVDIDFVRGKLFWTLQSMDDEIHYSVQLINGLSATTVFQSDSYKTKSIQSVQLSFFKKPVISFSTELWNNANLIHITLHDQFFNEHVNGSSFSYQQELATRVSIIEPLASLNAGLSYLYNKSVPISFIDYEKFHSGTFQIVGTYSAAMIDSVASQFPTVVFISSGIGISEFQNTLVQVQNNLDNGSTPLARQLIRKLIDDLQTGKVSIQENQ